MQLKSLVIMIMLAWYSTVFAEQNSEQPIFPQQLTARGLLTYCVSSSMTDLGRFRQRYCWGFVSGVEEAIRLPLVSANHKACVPEGLSAKKLSKAYITYARRQEAHLDLPAAQLVVKALSNAYPCPG